MRWDREFSRSVLDRCEWEGHPAGVAFIRRDLIEDADIPFRGFPQVLTLPGGLTLRKIGPEVMERMAAPYIRGNAAQAFLCGVVYRLTRWWLLVRYRVVRTLAVWNICDEAFGSRGVVLQWAWQRRSNRRKAEQRRADAARSETTPE